MCGIAGYINLKVNADQALIKRMTRIMHHRGPDGEGYHLDQSGTGTSASEYHRSGRRQAADGR